VCIIFSFSNSFFTTSLKDEKGVPEIYHGFIMSISSCFYLIFTIAVGYMIGKIPKRMFILISFAGCVIAIALTGPSYYFSLPNKLWILIIGQIL
jgi:MFS family permease